MTYKGPLFHATGYPAPEGHENPLVRATMNPGMDYPFIDVMGPVPDLRIHVLHHGASHVRLNGSFGDLSFLAPSADVITRLWIGSAEVGDVSALAALTALETLQAPPVSADPLLPLLPRLRILTLNGEHDWQVLSRCDALRELLITGAELETLALPVLDKLEMLSIGSRSPRRLAGLDHFPSLRTLVYLASPALDEETLQRLADRFDTPVEEILRRQSDPRGGMLAIRTVRLDADEGRARRAAVTVAAKAEHTARVTDAQPACVMLLLDRSASTEQEIGLDLRVIADVNAAEHEMTTRFGNGPDGNVRFADAISAAVNDFLRVLIARCSVDGRIVHDVHVGLIEYGARVGSVWEGALLGRTLMPVAEIAAHPLQQSPNGAEWVKPVFDGDTPLGDALARAHEIVAEWAGQHASSFPPVVINLNAGGTTGLDPVRDGWALRAVRTDDGPALFFNVLRDSRYGAPRFGVAGNQMTEREVLYPLSSVMPPCIDDAVRRAGYHLLDQPRGFFQDASAADFANLLHLFTALPGLPGPDAAIHHPLPPHVPVGWQIEQDAVPRVETPRAAPPWKMPKLRGPMTDDLFWRIIDKSDRNCDDPAERGGRITRMLEQLSADDIVAFEQLLEVALTRAYRWDLWAVAFMAKGGCSDDGFDYFCAWLVGQGRTYFEASLAKPEHAARRIAPGDEAEFEHLLSAAQDAYDTKSTATGWDARVGTNLRGEPAGDPWDEADLPRLYPRLAKKYA